MVELNAETAVRVSTSNPCDWDWCFMCISFLFPSDRDIGDTRGGINELAEASIGICHSNDVVGSLLTSTSCEEGPEGHSAWGCYRLHRRCKGGHRKIWCSQGRPGSHPRRLRQLPSSLTTLRSRFFLIEYIYREQLPLGIRLRTSSHVSLHWKKVSIRGRVT